MFLSGRFGGQSIHRVLEEKKAICDGYSNLFSALCNRLGVENVKILGYSKVYGYEPGQKFAVSNHAWNAVLLNEEWYLIDVTWGASRSNNEDFQASEGNLERYFLTEPSLFLLDHLPEDPQWQLVSDPVSIEDFESGKNIPKVEKSSKIDQNTDVYGKEIAHYARIITHNPRNRDARFRLGYAYLSKALDTLETIHTLPEENIFVGMHQLGERIEELLDEAEKHFGMIDSNHRQYDKSRLLLVECLYQKGVFNYEAGFQMLTLLSEMDEMNNRANFESYKAEVNLYWDLAIRFFERVPPGSLYTEQAQRYIDYYIPEYRP